MLLVLLLSSCDQAKRVSADQGDAFPRAQLAELLSGENVEIDISSKILVINFWATWCEPCREEMPTLQKLSDAANTDDLEVIGVSVDDDRNLMLEFLYQHKIRFANVQDKAQALAQGLLGIQAYPETFIVSPRGNIVQRIAGKRDWNGPAMHQLLDSIRNGEKVSRRHDNPDLSARTVKPRNLHRA